MTTATTAAPEGQSARDAMYAPIDLMAELLASLHPTAPLDPQPLSRGLKSWQRGSWATCDGAWDYYVQRPDGTYIENTTNGPWAPPTPTARPIRAKGAWVWLLAESADA